VQSGATFAATLAQHGLNAALAACPIVWIIGAVLALVVAFVAFAEQIEGAAFVAAAFFKNIGLSIANFGIAVWETIKNIWTWFSNLGRSIWGVFKLLADDLMGFFTGANDATEGYVSNAERLFDNAFTWIQIQFWGLIDSLLSGFDSLASVATSTLHFLGVDVDTSALDLAKSKIEGLSKQYHDIPAVTAPWKDNPIDWGGAWDKGTETFQDGWASDAYDEGAAYGAQFHDWAMGLLPSFGGGDEGAAFELGNMLDKISQNVENTAGNTAKMSASLSFAEEDLKYMRDVAEREAINRYTTAAITIEQNNENHISSEADLSTIIGKLNESLAETISIAAEGEHW
jgi:hypothetical protein